MLLQPDEPADDTPTLDKPAPASLEVDVSTAGTRSDKPAPTSLEIDVSPAGTMTEVIGKSTSEQSDAAGNELKNHTSFTVTDHTSPMSPCSPRSADDNGEQKLSTPGAASSGYGSAVLTQTTSSDDLLGDHVVNDDVTAHSSVVLTAGVSIIDAAVPSDLDSPLKPTTPYAEEPAALLPTSDTRTVVAVTTSDSRNVATESVTSDVDEAATCSKQGLSEEHPAIPRDLQISTRKDSESTDLTEPCEDEVADISRLVSDGDGRVDSGVKMNGCLDHAADDDSVVTSVSRRASLSVKAACRPGSVTISEDVNTLGMSRL